MRVPVAQKGDEQLQTLSIHGHGWTGTAIDIQSVSPVAVLRIQKTCNAIQNANMRLMMLLLFHLYSLLVQVQSMLLEVESVDMLLINSIIPSCSTDRLDGHGLHFELFFKCLKMNLKSKKTA
jgi:hypothetical protein